LFIFLMFRTIKLIKHLEPLFLFRFQLTFGHTLTNESVKEKNKRIAHKISTKFQNDLPSGVFIIGLTNKAETNQITNHVVLDFL
jgi:hypothetical protein